MDWARAPNDLHYSSIDIHRPNTAPSINDQKLLPPLADMKDQMTPLNDDARSNQYLYTLEQSICDKSKIDEVPSEQYQEFSMSSRQASTYQMIRNEVNDSKDQLDRHDIDHSFENTLPQQKHGGELLDVKDPTPGYLCFPGTFDDNGQRQPFREMFAQPQRSILPSVNDPMWKQMLDYCARWATWAATVDDEKRRSEILDWVTARMRQAWEYAVDHGHCGEPNGHTQCCDAHAKPKAAHSKEVRKRPVDHGRLPAPFNCEGPKHAHSIINRELGEAGLTMDEILSRITPHDLKCGRKLLQTMCDTLDRVTLVIKDWTTAKSGIFKPGFHARNLLMFGLFEAQRCYNVVTTSEAQAAKASGVSQQKLFQKRIEIHQERGDQHLAMAVILDERRPEEGGEEDDATDQRIINTRITRGSNQNTTSTAVVDISSGDEAKDGAESDTPELTSSASTDAGSVVSSREGSPKILRTSPTEQNLETEDFPCFGDTQTDQAIAISGYNVANDHSTANAVIGQKRGLSLVHSAAEGGSKRQKYAYNASLEHSPHQRNTSYQADSCSTQPVKQEFGGTGSGQFAQQMIGNIPVAYPHFGTSQQESSTTTHASSQESTLPTGEQHTSTEQVEHAYIAQIWQPRLNKLLANQGYPALKWNLTSWDEIDRLLQQLDVTVEERNQTLRAFNSELKKRRKANLQRSDTDQPPAQSRERLVLNPPKLRVSMPGPSLHDEINYSKGFSFRYLPSTSKRERDHADSMITEYISAIMHTKTARYGYYVVFIMQGDRSQKPLAHGIWNLRGKAEVEDAKWFYRNQTVPPQFRVHEPPLYHDWGYSLAPPKTRSKPKSTPKAVAFDQDEDMYTEETTQRGHGSRSKAQTPPRPSRKAQSHKSRLSRSKRNVIHDDTESDDDYDPEYD